MERETGFEPATSSLGSWHSTTELLPQPFKSAIWLIPNHLATPVESLKSLVSTKSTRLDRRMDTKTDTKPSLRIWPPNPSFGVHLGVHSSSKTVQPHYTTRLVRIARLEGDCRGPVAICARSKDRRLSLGCGRRSQLRDR